LLKRLKTGKKEVGAIGGGEKHKKAKKTLIGKFPEDLSRKKKEEAMAHGLAH